MFESEEEKVARRQRYVIITVLVIAALLLVVGVDKAWDTLKPLPQIKVCSELGYEAGKIIDGKEVCFEKCIDKEVEHCKSRRVIV